MLNCRSKKPVTRYISGASTIYWCSLNNRSILSNTEAAYKNLKKFDIRINNNNNNNNTVAGTCECGNELPGPIFFVSLYLITHSPETN
jgi:hypothetical protein